MDRRTWLKTGSMAALGMGLSGCSTRTSGGAGPSPATLELAPVDVAWDRIIRTTVGLRPHRPTGFHVGSERLGAKTVIHNYGHGGAGMSLSWGTAQLAADLALEHTDRQAAILGCGVAGLTTARALQRRGFGVTIYTKDVPPNTTSNKSFAGWTPTSGLIGAGRRTAAWDAQFRQAARTAYRELQLLVGANYGVSWIDFYSMRGNEAPEPSSGSNEDALLPASLRAPSVILGPDEHPFPVRYVSKEASLRIEPSIYLDALVRDVRLAGGQITIREFASRQDLMELDQSLIVNCTGLGSRTLFDDAEMMPIKGQLTVLVPQTEVGYGTLGGLSRGGGFPIHMQPRGDGIVLGGTSEWDEWSTEPNQDAMASIVQQHMEFFQAMSGHAVT